MALATINGSLLTTARLTLPETGAWLYDGTTSETVMVSEGSSAQVTAGNISLTGTVVRAVAFEGRTQFRVVGGAGWCSPVSPRAYTSSAGLSFAIIAGDAARETGERLGSSVPSSSVGYKYVRMDGPASQVFALLGSGVRWWVDDSGATQFGQRETGPIAASFQSMDYDGSRGMLRIATDEPSAFRPGKTVSAPNIGNRIISAAIWNVATDSLRGELWIA